MCDYSEYNGDAVHDMWVDYTYQQNTGGGDGGGYYLRQGGGYVAQEMSLSQQIRYCRMRIQSFKANLSFVDRERVRMESMVATGSGSQEEIAKAKRFLAKLPKRVAKTQRKLAAEETKLTELLIKRERQLDIVTICVCAIAVFVALICLTIFM